MVTASLLLAAALSQATANTVDIVSVSGCLKQPSPDTWLVANATDPVPSVANAPPAKEIPATPPSGRNEFRLIGVSEFNLPAHKDRAVIVKGLLIKAAPTSRLNMTSIVTIAPSCPVGAK